MRHGRDRIALLTGLLALGLLLPRLSAAACDRAISAAAANELNARLRTLGAADGCTWAGLSTQVSDAQATWRKPQLDLGVLQLAPHGCLPDATMRGSLLDAAVPPRLQAACPSVVRGLPAALGAVSVPLPVLGQSRDGARGAFWERNPPPVRGMILATAWLWLGAFLLAIALPLSRVRAQPPPRTWLLSLVGATALALLLRLAVPSSMANWYLEVLDPSGSGDIRFGPGALGVQRLLFAVLPLSDTTLFRAGAVAGALAVPLTMGIALRVGLSQGAALMGGLLLALLPLHLRVSVSGGAHIWSSLAQLAALWLWLGGVQQRRLAWLGTAGLFALLAAVTRIDSFAQLLLPPLIGLLLSDAPRDRWLWKVSATWLLLWLLTGILAYFAIVLPSHHPAPPLQGIEHAARALLSQFARASAQPPHWLPAWTVLLAVAGLASAAWKRRPLLLATLAVLLLTFVPLGRTLEREGLVTGRYFCFVLCWLALVAGLGADAVLARVRRPRPRWIVAGLLLLLAALSAPQPLGTRYAFQDEYDFLRRTTARLPAGCTVTQVPVRDRAYLRDFDCCLDAARSPLTLARPDLKWQTLILGQRLPEQPPGCMVYYQSALCDLQVTPEVLRYFPVASRLSQDACRQALDSTEVRRVAESRPAALSTRQLFERHPPLVWLGWVGAKSDAGR